MKRGYIMEPSGYITNNKPCPVCGSDMRRDATDSPHDMYTGHYTCANHECNISTTIHN